MKRVVHWIIAMMLTTGVLAEDWDVHRPSGAGYQFSGLSVFVDAGLLLADNRHANFYNGSEGNANTIYRVLHSQAYGQQIWTDLVDKAYISPSAIQNYGQLQVAEYANMDYRLAYQLGIGFRYDYPKGWGWLCRFDYAMLNAVGAFLLSSTNSTGLLTDRDQYVRCGIYGEEKRINIDLGATKRIPLTDAMEIELDLGCNIVNTEVLQNKIEIADRPYDILDKWNGQTPDMGTVAYEYINQGGIGIGGFASVSGCYKLEGASMSVGYTCYYNTIQLDGYEAYAPQHNIFLRFDLNNFSFFDG